MAFTDVFKKAGGWIKSHPAYSIGGAAGLAVLGYLYYEQKKTASSTASGASGTQPSSGDMNATPSYDYLYGFYQGDQSLPPGADPTTTPPPPGGTLPAAPGNGSLPPVPAPPSSAVYYTTKAGDTLMSIQYIDKLWGDATIKANNPQVAKYGLTDKLPAGLRLQVGGPLPGTGVGDFLSGFAHFYSHDSLTHGAVYADAYKSYLN